MKLAALVLATLAMASTACARPLVDVTVTDLTDAQLLPTYLDRGDTYIPGRPGHRYSLTLRNTTGERVLAVVSVDGVNAVTGETASAQQAGYVLGPWETAEVKGWRKSLSDVAEFYFTELPDSYAARTGRPDHVGVIGVAVFRERVRREFAQPSVAKPAAPYPRAEPQRGTRDTAAAASAPARASQESAPAADTEALAKKLGTGHGERVYDPVGTTAFEKQSSRPQQVTRLFYDDVEVLVARGIIPRPHHAPDPFPIGFVPDPR